MSLFGDVFGGGKEAEGAEEGARLARKSYKQLKPYRELGSGAATMLKDVYLTGEQPYTASPGYDFRRGEALRGMERMLASRGLSGSGRAIRGTARLLDDLATAEYDQGFNRLATLAGIGGTGQAQSQQALGQAGQYGYLGGQARQSGYNQTANTLAGLAGMFF